MKRRTWTMLAVAFMGSYTLWAEEDGPGRGVARISLTNGDVSVRRGDNGDLIAAAVNTPLVAEDHVITGPNSRTEVQFDYASMLRLGSNSEVRLADLENQRYQVQLSRGTAMISVLRDSQAQMELDTPSVSVRPRKRGDYRVTVREDGDSEITVRSGEAEVFSPQGVETLRPGRTMLVRGTPSNPEFQMVATLDRDDFDQWNEQRDRTLERSRSYEYVSRDIYGADELDRYGRWIYDPPYGWVWAPDGVGPGWAPYRNGRWSWLDYYGWSWIDYSPWGWAPYHYGRWYWGARYGWCWYPGPVYHRHYWRPALVAFFGFGSGPVHIGFGFGRIGWVPLAPYEPYYPWYGRGLYGGFRNRTYIDNSVRIVNNVNVVNVYRNARVVNGVTGLDSEQFVRGRGGSAIRVSDSEFRRASLVQGALPITPAAESLRVTDRQARVANLSQRTAPTRFYSRQPAAAVDRVPFEQQRQGMEQIVRRSFGEARGQVAETGARSAQGGSLRSGAAAPETGNMPRTGGLDRSGARSSMEAGKAQDAGGWRRIGQPSSIGVKQETNRSWRNAGEPAQTQGTVGGSARMPDANLNRSREGWRGFGASSGQSESSAPAGSRRLERNASPESQPGAGTDAPSRGIDRGSGNSRRDSGNWQGFGGRPQDSGAAPSVDRNPGSLRRESGDRGGRSSAPDTGSGSVRSQSRSEGSRFSGERLNLNPPIVRERSTPRFDSAPRSAPRGESMGRMGGGESRGGSVRSGGGGGGHSGGGGRSRSR